MKKIYKRLSYKERVIIETLLKENKSKNYIAKQLKRNRATITREVKLWVIKPTDIYKADLAHSYAVDTNKYKHCSDKINDNPRLKMFIFRNLILGTSPELIAGRLKILHPNDPTMSISHESIYSYIYRHRQTKLAQKLIKLLPYHHHKRRKQRKFGTKNQE